MRGFDYHWKPPTKESAAVSSNTDLLRTVVRELFARPSSPRTTEPDLIMDDPAKVAAFNEAGRENGVMAPVYLYHAAQVSEVTRPGETVLDLGCGPANQLTMIARLNPESRFIGVDLSDEMLTRARHLAQVQKLQNVSFVRDDITRLEHIADQSCDAVYSTVVLHHLPDTAALDRCFAQIARVLKPGGGIYLVDFGHLKSDKSIEYFAYQYQDRQPELFTADYLYSLRAAFTVNDFKQAYNAHLTAFGRFYRMLPLPFMMAIKSPARRDIDSRLAEQLLALRRQLPAYHEVDIANLIQLFRFGGLRSPLATLR